MRPRFFDSRQVAYGALLLSWATLVYVAWNSESFISFGSSLFNNPNTAAPDFWPIESVSQRQPNSETCQNVTMRSAFSSVPTKPILSAERHCSMRDWTKGDWIYSGDANDTLQRTGLDMTYLNRFQPDYDNAERQSWLWEWRSNSSRCQTMPPFDPIRLCSALGRGSILFVGDSLQANMIAAFRHQLESNRRDALHERPCQNPQWSDEYEQSVVVCPSGARLDYIRNDHLSLTDHDDLECHDRCFPWIQAVNQYDFLFLNTGLHTLDIDLFQFQTRQTVEYLREHYHGRVIYRLASEGHENCMDYNRPWTNAEFATLDSVHRSKPYRWHFVDSYNDIAWKWYSTLPGAVILDSNAIVRLRPDVHRSKGDCLHHTIPGPWDYTVLMLYYVLVGDFS